jgi:glycosyltransferase involved in cell wall biosynthesis
MNEFGSQIDRPVAAESHNSRYTGSLVSVVLPVYNDEDTVSRCLDSICNQSYDNIEIIIVDDGSTDSTPRILRQAASVDKRITLITTEHVGSSAAKNIGVRFSKGRVIFFAEGDAIYDPDYLREATECLDSDISTGGVCVLGEPWIARKTFTTDCLYTEKLLIHDMVKNGRLEPYYAWVFPRRVLDVVGVFDPNLTQAEDRDLFARVKKGGFRIGLVQKVLWRHKRSETTAEFLQKCYDKGKRRIRYISKNRRYMEFVRGTIGLWGILSLLLLAYIIHILFWLALGVVALGFVYRSTKLYLLARNSPVHKTKILSLALFQALRYLANGFGYSVGAIQNILGRDERSN